MGSVWRRDDSVHAAPAGCAARESAADRENVNVRSDGFVDVCGVNEIPEKRAVMTCLSGERVAVFRYDGRISAISNVCQHQNGPLGEGRMVNGCVVCPWHGYEYAPARARRRHRSPRRCSTFDVRVSGRSCPRAPAAACARHARRTRGSGRGSNSMTTTWDEFFIGYAPPMPAGSRAFVARIVIGPAARRPGLGRHRRRGSRAARRWHL